MPGRRSTLLSGRAQGAAAVVLAVALLAESTAAPAQSLPAEPAQQPALSSQPTEPSPTAGGLVLSHPNANFDDRYQFETVNWSYEVVNRSGSPVRITQRIAIDRTGQVTAPLQTIAPGGSARIEVAQPLADRLGEVAFRYALLTDEPGAPRYRFTLSGFVQSAYDPEKPVLDFGVLDRARGGKAEASVASREVAQLLVLGVEAAPPYLHLTWSAPVDASPPETGGEASTLVSATLAPGSPQGLLGGILQLRTNVPHQPLVPIRFVAQVFGDVVPQENPVRLGAVRIGETRLGVVRLQSRSGRTFEVSSAADSAGPAGPLAVVVRTCDGSPAPSACQVVELRLTPLAPGPVTGSVVVQIAGESSPLPLLYNALAIRPDAVIHQLELPPAETASPDPERLP